MRDINQPAPFNHHAYGAKALAVNAPQRHMPQKIKARVQHIWVLHKRIAVRVFALILAVAVFGSALYYRQALVSFAANVAHSMSVVFSGAGLSLAQLSLSGYALTPEDQLFGAVGLEPNMSLVNFDAASAQKRLEALPSITRATIRKVYPNSLIVNVVEKKPVAVWSVEGVHFAIDAQGKRIAQLDQVVADLPLFVGDGAADDVPSMLAILAKFPKLSEGLVAISRIADRRWDLIYDFGLRIMLPEDHIETALAQIVALDDEKDLLGRDIEVIDMRVAHIMAVRPYVRAPQEDEGTPE